MKSKACRLMRKCLILRFQHWKNANGFHVDALEQIIYIEITGNNVDSCVRFDATENNIEQVLKFMNGEIEKMTFDEFKKGATAKSLEEIFKVADAIMV